jgi:hypothetical protein
MTLNDCNKKLVTGLKTKLKPNFSDLSESFLSGGSQKKCREVLTDIVRLLKADLVRSNIIEYKGVKLKLRFSGTPSWRFSQVYSREDYDYELYFRFHDDDTLGCYLINRTFFSSLVGSLAHPPCRVIKTYTMNKKDRQTIISNKVV